MDLSFLFSLIAHFPFSNQILLILDWPRSLSKRKNPPRLPRHPMLFNGFMHYIAHAFKFTHLKYTIQCFFSIFIHRVARQSPINLILEHFCHAKKKGHTPFSHFPFLPLLSLFLISVFLALSTPCKRDHTIRGLFCRLLSLRVLSLAFIHTVVYTITPFLFIARLIDHWVKIARFYSLTNESYQLRFFLFS